MKTLTLYKTMFKQTALSLRRYLFDSLSGVFTLYLFFLAIFYGVKSIASGSQVEGTLESIVVRFALWTMAIFAYFSMAESLTQEAQLGTLEQLAMSPLGLGRVLFGRALAGLVWQLFMITVLVTAMMASTGKWLHIDIFSILPLALLTIAAVVGVSFVMGGLAIVFKRVQAALQIMQMAFIAFLAVPIATVPAIKFAPLAWGSNLLERVMLDEQSLLSIPAGDLLFLLIHGVAYIAGGLLVFRYLEEIARRRGLLGHY